jgi:hypothetical protein
MIHAACRPPFMLVGTLALLGGYFIQACRSSYTRFNMCACVHVGAGRVRPFAERSMHPFRQQAHPLPRLVTFQAGWSGCPLAQNFRWSGSCCMRMLRLNWTCSTGPGLKNNLFHWMSSGKYTHQYMVQSCSKFLFPRLVSHYLHF